MTRNPLRLNESGIRGWLALTLGIPPRVDTPGAAPKPREPDLMAEARRRILHHLAEHPRATVRDVPRAFPVTPILLRMAAAQLIARGLIEPFPDSEKANRGMLRLTDRGRGELGEGSSPSENG